MPRRATPILATFVASLVLALTAASSGAAPTTGTGGDLYVLQATGGALDGSKLVLRGVETGVTTFTDRPQRSAGSLPLARFAGTWGKIFGSVPPNAALQVQGAPQSRDVAVLELRRPHYDAADDTLTYSVKRLRKTGDPALRTFDRRADGDAVKSFGRASLFIDDGEAAPLVPVEVEAVLPSFSSVSLKFDDAEVTFGTSDEDQELGPQELGPGSVVSPPEGAPPGTTPGTSISIRGRTLEISTFPGATSTVQVQVTVYVTEPASGKVTGKAQVSGAPTATIVSGGEGKTLAPGPFSLPAGEPG